MGILKKTTGETAKKTPPKVAKSLGTMTARSPGNVRKGTAGKEFYPKGKKGNFLALELKRISGKRPASSTPSPIKRKKMVRWLANDPDQPGTSKATCKRSTNSNPKKSPFYLSERILCLLPPLSHFLGIFGQPSFPDFLPLGEFFPLLRLLFS